MIRKSFIALVTLVLAGMAGLWWYLSRPLKTAPVGDAAQEAAEIRQAAAERRAAAQTNAPQPRAPLSLPNLSPAVRQVLDATVNGGERFAALRSLPADLRPADLAGLNAFLLQPAREDETPFTHVLKNEVMDRLPEVDGPLPREIFTKLFLDRQQNEVVRDYALQHLIEFTQRAAESTERQMPAAEYAEVTRVLWQALEETDSSIAGTALLGLSRLNRFAAVGIARDRVASAAERLASEPGTGPFTRTTAIQVCAQMNLTNALPVIWQTAQAGGDLPLRLAAIGALGVMNQTDARPFLNEILQGDVAALKPAANEALLRLAAYDKRKAKELEDELDRKRFQELREQQKARKGSANP